MARENEKLAVLAILHEAREVLARQNNNCRTKSHRIAMKLEKAYVKKLGFDKSGGWLLREFYGWGKG